MKKKLLLVSLALLASDVQALTKSLKQKIKHNSSTTGYHMETDVQVAKVTSARQQAEKVDAQRAQKLADDRFEKEVVKNNGGSLADEEARREQGLSKKRADGEDGSIIPNFDENAYIKGRQKASLDLVERAIEYLKTNDEDVAFSAFNNDKNFSDGDIYLFAYNAEGVCLAHGEEDDLIWQNMYDYKDIYGTYIVRAFLEKARQGGGWLTYQWRNATKVSYVKELSKGGKTYILGAGYYPHSKRDAAVSLVRSAVEYFKEQIKSGGSAADAFSKFSYPLGRFVQGDLYLYALDFDGNIMAQGERPGLIGQNSLNYQDSEGRFTNKEIIEKLKNSKEGIWVEYKSKRARKIAYAEKVTDDKGKNYFIACGYYPEAGRKQVIDLVLQGFRYMEMHGRSQAAEQFNSKTSNAFRYGDLFIMVYDEKGVCIANGGNPDYVGINQSDIQDDDGKFIVRDILRKASEGGGWIDFRMRNAFYFVYAKNILVGKDRYAICSGLYPISKPETLQLIVKGAVSFMASNPREKVFAEMVKRNGRFIRGDLSTFVFDSKGICYAYGDEHEFIWRNMLAAKDEEGREYVKLFINTAKQGPGRVTYTMNGKQKVAYVEPVEKDGIQYVIGSSFFR